MSTSLLVADILCARENEQFKARLLSTTMFLSGMCTVLQNTIGVRFVQTCFYIYIYIYSD